MKNFFTFVVVLCLPFYGLHASGVVPEAFKQAFKAGNAQEVSKYFNSVVELDILGKDDVCNKTKAEQILSRFFAQYPVASFSVIYEGGKDANTYAIGKLTTSKGIFRVNILLKDTFILQLRIEGENGN